MAKRPVNYADERLRRPPNAFGEVMKQRGLTELAEPPSMDEMLRRIEIMRQSVVDVICGERPVFDDD